MPTMLASVGTSTGWKGYAASRPRTKKTRSPTPAPAASVATSARPTSLPSRATGWIISSLTPDSRASLCEQTTVPTTRARCMGGRSRSGHRDGVDDADDGRVHRRLAETLGHARGTAGDDEHHFAGAGIDGVD